MFLRHGEHIYNMDRVEIISLHKNKFIKLYFAGEEVGHTMRFEDERSRDCAWDTLLRKLKPLGV